MHRSLHHPVADAPWDDEVLLDHVLNTALPAMLRQGPIMAWAVDALRLKKYFSLTPE